MAERHRPGAGHFHEQIARHVATGTLRQGEGPATFMTCPARSPFFHLRHGYGTVSPCLEEAWVTIYACQLCSVGSMEKGDVSGRFDAKGDIPDRMASTAV